MDEIDRNILYWLQRDAGLSMAELSVKVGLSTTPCWRRVQMLEKSGTLKAKVVLVDPKALNLGTELFVRVKTNRHDAQWLDAFARAVQDIPEIIEVHRLTGEIDYLMRVVVPDIETYDAVYQRIIDKVPFSDVSASIVMERIKQTSALPVKYA